MEEILEKVKAIVREAGSEIMRLYGAENIATEKPDKTLVTDADLLSEKIILEGLAEFDYGTLSEERLSSDDRITKKRTWVIDPIDGTMDFVKKTGEFSIMVGLVEDGKVILGVVYQPSEDKLYYATSGGGSFLEKNGAIKELKVSNNSDFSQITMFGARHHVREMEIKLYNNLGITDFITCGSAGLKMGLITEKKADVYINSSNKTAEWDICAGDIIVTEAGGMVTDLDGTPIVYNKESYLNLNGFVVTNGVLHDRVIEGIKSLKGKG